MNTEILINDSIQTINDLKKIIQSLLIENKKLKHEIEMIKQNQNTFQCNIV